MTGTQRQPPLASQEPANQGQNSKPTAMSSAHQSRIHWLWLIQTGAGGILLTLGLMLLVQQVIAVSQGSSDFCQDYIAAQRLAQGTFVYLPLHVSSEFNHCPPSLLYDAHPPFSVLLFLPLSFLPYSAAALLWGLGSLVAYLASGTLLLQALGWRSLRGLALFVIGSVYWEPLIGAEGAQNLWQALVLLLTLAWLLERRGRVGWAGILLGLAALLKIWPVIFLLGALAQRQWRLALAGGLTIALGTALTLGVMGPGAYSAYFGPVQASEALSVPANGNISLVGVVTRLFTGDLSLMPPVMGGLSLDGAIKLGEAVAGALLAGTLAYIGWRWRRLPGTAPALLCQGMLATVTLLAFPVAWYFGLTILLLSCATLILALRQLPRPPRWWFVLLGASLLPLLAPYSLLAFAGWLFGQQISGYIWLTALVLALPTLGVGCFAGAQGYVLWQATLRHQS